MKILETERLILREWNDKDIAVFVKMQQCPNVMTYFPRPYTVEETMAFVERVHENFKLHGYSYYACERKDTGEFIGFVGIMPSDFDAPFTPCIQIGWRLSCKHWGKGFATEAAQKVIDYGLRELGIKEIVSFTSPLNVPSVRVMEKLGMVRGPQDDFEFVKIPPNSPLRMHVLYRLSRDTYLKNKK